MHQRLQKILAENGVRLDGIYVCPHLPEDGCSCRKPHPGLIESAAKELDFNPKGCIIIGDKACDIGLGQSTGATTFLVRTSYGAQVADESKVPPDYVVDDVAGAANVIKRLIAGGENG
jgi:D-glycero-D-manno-heptose 1,7-bisphosphate phosphatase